MNNLIHFRISHTIRPAEAFTAMIVAGCDSPESIRARLQALSAELQSQLRLEIRNSLDDKWEPAGVMNPNGDYYTHNGIGPFVLRRDASGYDPKP